MIGVIVQQDECASHKTLPKELQCRYLRRRAIHIEVEVGDATGMYLWQCFRNRTFDNNCISPLRKVLTYGFDTLHIESARKMNSVFLERPGLLVFGRKKAFIQSAEGIAGGKLFSKDFSIPISHGGADDEAP